MGEKENKLKEKEKRIKKEMAKIKKFYKNLSKSKQEKLQELIYRAAFLLVMAKDMELEIMNMDKFISTTINASQTFTKPNPLLKEYRDTVKSYQAVIKQLNDLTKEDLTLNPDSEKDELDEFLDS